MRAALAGIGAALAIAAIAGLVLTQLNPRTADRESVPSTTRLDRRVKDFDAGF